MVVPAAGLTFGHIKQQVGNWIGAGYGTDRGDPALGRREGYTVRDAAVGGIRNFYSPPKLPGEMEAYRWSFLRPVLQVTLASGAQAAPLPPEFGGLDGPATPEATDGSSQSFWPVTRTNELRIRKLFSANPTATGRPCEMAEDWGQKAGGRPQQCRLVVFPIADQEYLLRFRCFITPSAEMDDNDVVWGGAEHEQTVIASCKAWAEAHLDDERGVMKAEFMELLAASISRDRQRKGEMMGYNGDGRGRIWDRRGSEEDHTLYVTYNGTLY